MAKAWSAQFAYTHLAIQLEEVIDQNGCCVRRYIDHYKADCLGPGCEVSAIKPSIVTGYSCRYTVGHYPHGLFPGPSSPGTGT